MKVIVEMQTLGYTFCYLQKSSPIFHLETGSKTFQSLLSPQFTNFNHPPHPPPGNVQGKYTSPSPASWDCVVRNLSASILQRGQFLTSLD